jgi:orotidine-5'-phosphate decarboxylase
MPDAALELGVPAFQKVDPRLIVALDVPTAAEAEALVERIGDDAMFLQDRIPAGLCRRIAAGA